MFDQNLCSGEVIMINPSQPIPKDKTLITNPKTLSHF